MDFPLSLWDECKLTMCTANANCAGSFPRCQSNNSLTFTYESPLFRVQFLQEIKKKQQQALKNLMYVFIYCPKLTNRREITIKSCVLIVTARLMEE